MAKRIVMVMGVQRSGTTTLFEAFDAAEGVSGFNEPRLESPSDLIYDNFYLRPEPEIRNVLREAPGIVLLKPISETFRRSVQSVLDEYAAYDLSVVWIYRDPINVYYSQERMGLGVLNDRVPDLAREWNARNRSVLECLPQPAGRITVVRYEDLIRCNGLLEAVGQRIGIRPKNVFQCDSGAGRRAVPPDAQALMDQLIAEVRTRLDAARLMPPSTIGGGAGSAEGGCLQSGRTAEHQRPRTERGWIQPEELTGPEFQTDPHARFREWRVRGSVFRLRGPGTWLLLNYEDVAAALTDSRFSSAIFKELNPSLMGNSAEGHARVRAALDPYFAAGPVSGMQQWVEERTRTMLRQLEAQPEFDLVASIAYLTKFISWRFVEVWKDAAALVPAASLTGEEVLDLSKFIPVAGILLSRTLSTMAYLLLQRPELAAWMQKQPEEIPAFVEEFLRLHPPSLVVARTAATAVEIAGETIPEGDLAYLAVAAANRDPRVYQRPDEFIPHRPPPPHLSFGGGPHFCLGATFARMTCATILRVLLTEFPSLWPARPLAEVKFGDAPFVFGPFELYARFTTSYVP